MHLVCDCLARTVGRAMAKAERVWVLRELSLRRGSQIQSVQAKEQEHFLSKRIKAPFSVKHVQIGRIRTLDQVSQYSGSDSQVVGLGRIIEIMAW